MKYAQQFSQVQTDIVNLNGGMDQVTPTLQVKPGRVIISSNFEPDIFGGYKYMAGIERFDGQVRPSDGKYHVFACNITGTVTAGDTVTGSISAATAVVILVVSSIELIVTKVSGTFVAEDFEVSAVVQGTVSSVDQEAASTTALHATYKNLAADEYRGDITTVPGSGPVRGVHYYSGNLYAFRDNAGVTACIMYKETTSGWSAITFGKELQFDNAVGEIFEGDTVTGLSSGANGVVTRALLRTGTWSTAGVGTLVFDSVTGGPFTDNEALQVSAGTKADADGVEAAITLLPGGRFEFDNIAFRGGVCMYAVDGVNDIGEFDGTRWVSIRTGITGSKPKFVFGHRNHLFVAVDGSLQHSGIADPFSWTALTGAAELALGEDCTGILPQTGDVTSGALVATTDRKVFILYGTSSADWNLVLHSPDSGGRSYTLQNIGFAHFLDTKGVTQLIASQAFGGFQLSVLTQSVQTLIDNKRGLEQATCIVRSTNQYRIFYSDGTGLICQIIPNSNSYSPSFGAIMPFDYGEKTFNVVTSTVDISGIERRFAGGNDGYVYELDKGTSHDGDVISAYFLTVFNHAKSPRTRKRYKRTVLQMRDVKTANFSVGYDLSYGDSDAAYGTLVSASVQAEGGLWDVFTWGAFTWDAPYANQVTVDTKGAGESLALIISSETDEDEQYTIHTAITHYTMGRDKR